MEGGRTGGCRTEQREQWRKKHTPGVQVRHLYVCLLFFVYALEESYILYSYILQFKICIKTLLHCCTQIEFQNKKYFVWGSLLPRDLSVLTTKKGVI